MRLPAFPVRWLALIFAAALLALALPRPASAEVLVIWPDKLKKLKDTYQLEQSPKEVRGINGGVVLIAPIDLPVGSLISKIVYMHYGYTGAHTTASLYRAKVGAMALSYLPQGESYNQVAAIVPVSMTYSPPAKVDAGYRYYLYCTLFNTNSYVRGIKVVYTRPAQ